MKATLETIGVKINELGNTEKITKALLSDLSREVLTVVLLDDGKDAGKGTEDSRTLNELLEVLTPVNKRAAILFFQHFVPFLRSTNEAGEFVAFGKKNKKQWEKKLKLVNEFLADPHQNIWSWSERNIEMNPKPYDVNKVTKEIEKALKKAERSTVIKAIMAGGLTLEDILEVMAPKEEEEQN